MNWVMNTYGVAACFALFCALGMWAGAGAYFWETYSPKKSWENTISENMLFALSLVLLMSVNFFVPTKMSDFLLAVVIYGGNIAAAFFCTFSLWTLLTGMPVIIGMIAFTIAMTIFIVPATIVLYVEGGYQVEMWEQFSAVVCCVMFVVSFMAIYKIAMESTRRQHCIGR